MSQQAAVTSVPGGQLDYFCSISTSCVEAFRWGQAIRTNAILIQASLSSWLR